MAFIALSAFDDDGAEPLHAALRRRSVGALFEPEPAQWGMRGDEPVWQTMRSKLTGTPPPDSRAALEELLHATFTDTVGVDMRTEPGSIVSHERFVTGGLSSGMIHLDTWRNRLIPLLISRAAPPR